MIKQDVWWELERMDHGIWTKVVGTKRETEESGRELLGNERRAYARCPSEQYRLVKKILATQVVEDA